MHLQMPLKLPSLREWLYALTAATRPLTNIASFSSQFAYMGFLRMLL
jgi:hypothetical protein